MTKVVVLRCINRIRRRLTRVGFTLIELLVVMAIVGLLVAIALPAIQRSRESARQTECKNNLRQHGVALQSHQSQHGTLPKDGENGWGLQVFLLPGLEQGPLFEKLAPFSKPPASQLIPEPGKTDLALPIALCPSDPMADHAANGFGRSAYLGTFEIFSKKISLSDIYDGESNTIAMGETTTDHTWALAGTGTCDKLPNGGGSFGSFHPDGANFVMCDGSVRFLASNLDQTTFHALCTKTGRESIGNY